MIEKTGNVKLITKQMLLDDILSFDGTIEEYLREAEKELLLHRSTIME